MLKSAPIRIILGLLSAVAFFGLFYPFFVYLVFFIRFSFILCSEYLAAIFITIGIGQNM